MSIKFKNENIFNFPYFSFKIDPSKYNKEEIISTAIENYNKQPVRNKWDLESNLHHSYNDSENPLFKKINYSFLHPLYLSSFHIFLDELGTSNNKNNWRVDIDNYTVTSKNQYMKPHCHVPSVFSGVHYLKYDKENDMPIVFKNPFADETSNYTNLNTMQKYNWMYPEVAIDIEEDDFIIFPSILRHFIPMSKSDTKRISIVSNMWYIEGNGGTYIKKNIFYN